jgi:hypothetical protein
MVAITKVSGSGIINFGGSLWTSQSLNTGTFIQTNGDSVVANGNFANLTLITGDVNITSTATITNFDLRGGNVFGVGQQQVPINSQLLKVSTPQPKYLDNVLVNTSDFVLQCPGASCQLFTINAAITTSSSQT